MAHSGRACGRFVERLAHGLIGDGFHHLLTQQVVGDELRTAVGTRTVALYPVAPTRSNDPCEGYQAWANAPTWESLNDPELASLGKDFKLQVLQHLQGKPIDRERLRAIAAGFRKAADAFAQSTPPPVGERANQLGINTFTSLANLADELAGGTFDLDQYAAAEQMYSDLLDETAYLVRKCE